VAGPENAKYYASSSIIHKDNLPFIEYSSPQALYHNTQTESLQDIFYLRGLGDFKNIKGGDKKTMEKYFTLRQKLIPVRTAFLRGDIDQVLALYRKAIESGAQNIFYQNEIFKEIVRRAENLRMAGKEKESQKLYEKASFIINEIK
jgi:hypothetical protein